MVEHNSSNPPQEDPQVDWDYSYTPVGSKNALFKEIAASITFTFGKRIPESFHGYSFNITDNNKSQLEAESFIDAARSAWKRYRRNENARGYVGDRLAETWQKLDGERLIGKAIQFDPESDEIVKTPEGPKE